MVFSGRPSTACEPCRKWRLKCDRAVPTCTQCVRKNFVCKGYRDPTQLRLRNETERVTLKHQTTKKRDHTSQPVKAPPSFDLETAINLADASDTPEDDVAITQLQPYTPRQSTECEAMSYFINAYILSSPFEGYLPSMYANSSPNDNLVSAVHAAAFATLALRHKDANHMKRARASYTRALIQTNACLASPEDAVLDKTLAAVLVLGLFESISFRGNQSPESWTAHTVGAVELLRLRGLQQFQSKVACQLFLQTMVNIRTSYLQRSMTVPEEFVKLDRDAAPYLGDSDPSALVGPFIDRVARVREQAMKSTSIELVLEAIELDQDIVEFTNNLSPVFRFTIRPQEDTPSWAYLSIAHRYYSPRIAKFWNALRMMRCFLNELVGYWTNKMAMQAHCMSPKNERSVDPPYAPEFIQDLRAAAIDNLRSVGTDILATVPDFVERGSMGTTFSLAARTLVWPLTVIYKCSLCDPLARKHAVKLLFELGKDLNLAQAIEASKMSGEWNISEDW